MVTGLLFKWEDSPGLIIQELGLPASAPILAMFMRNKSHTCHYCRTIDEAHRRRHKRIAEGIRDVYESCGLEDWTIAPAEPEERGRIRGHDPGETDGDDQERSVSTEDTAVTSKREKKDAKALARAASRTRFISQEEINHVDSVIHSAEGFAVGDDGPHNTEEMDEIERHLKYNANVYNSQPDRRELKKYARLADVDVDFDAEIERILEAFRVADLLKSNTRNRGLQGKELKTFQTVVEDLKKSVVNDLVLVKRDALETRMRRAGYLRYTNKTAHSIVEDRYNYKNWKTGEKYSATTSSSSENVSAADEISSTNSLQSEDSPTLLPETPQDLPDRRHLEHIHTRVSGDDGLGQNVIEPYHAPLLSMDATPASRKPAVQLKLVAPGTMTSKATQKKVPQANNGAWATVLSGKKPKTPSVKPVWGMTAAGRPVQPTSRPVNPWGPDACEIPDLRSFRSSSVQLADSSLVTASKGPESFVVPSETPANVSPAGHAIVSQKKAKKYEREARRKAKKLVVDEDADVALDITTADHDTIVEADHPRELDASANPGDSLITKEVLNPLLEGSLFKMPAEDATVVATDEPEPEPCVAPLVTTSPPPPLTVHNSKHSHWKRFERQFTVDQLAEPFLSGDSGCAHLNTCVYETSGEVDCPYHKPHCSCVDPFFDECCLSYPGEEFLFSGPFNRLRAEKLLTMYQEEEHFTNRIMLVDYDIMDYLQLDSVTRMFDKSRIPKRLAYEYEDFADGYSPGRLMKQEELFERLRSKNKLLKHKITQEMLGKVARERFERKDQPFMCYCHVIIPEEGLPKGAVECAHRGCSMKYFHKACVKKLGVDKVSRWYCTECQHRIRILAHQTLRSLGYDDVPDEEAEFERTIELIKEKTNLSGDAIEKMRGRLRLAGSGARASGMLRAMVEGLP
ncbi:hypothetical protein HBI27_173950 [Parastagonospora nodorum]|nr:hypothetical protein HBI27_173950 [Parastagonospora nodorum]